MPQLPRSAIVAMSASTANARNDTLVHGWVSEPAGRGTWSILCSCFATISLCTWSALHLKVPTRHGRWYSIRRKLIFMAVAVTTPEWVLAEAANRFFLSWDESKRLARRRGCEGWTLTHLLFGRAEGFQIRSEKGEISRHKAKKLCQLIENGDLGPPPISSEELHSRGKSHWLIKLITIIHILWLAINTLVRAIRFHQVTPLEIMTIAFVLCSIFVYGFSWYMPQNVEYPVTLDLRKPMTVMSGPLHVTVTNLYLYTSSGKMDTEGVLQLFRDSRRKKVDDLVEYDRGFFTEHGGHAVFWLFMTGLGTIHCMAWNSQFPTWTERLAWRIFSAATAVLPALGSLLMWRLVTEWRDGMPTTTTLTSRLFLVMVGTYITLRIGTMILAVLALRALPADAFQTVNWTTYIPHITA